MFTDEDLHRYAAENLGQADALLFGRITYEMMEAAWRPPARAGVRPNWMADWMELFARTIDAAKKYVVSSTLDRVDRNAELVRGDHLRKAVQQLKRELGKGLFVGGVKLPLALAELGLIDEYEFVVQPRLVGHRPTLFAGLSKHVDLKLVSRLEFGSGAVAMQYDRRERQNGAPLRSCAQGRATPRSGAPWPLENNHLHRRAAPRRRRRAPDFNPVEMAFAKLKAALRAAAARTVPDLWQAIADALRRFTPLQRANYLAAAECSIEAGDQTARRLRCSLRRASWRFPA